jgi:hypothetical protein
LPSHALEKTLRKSGRIDESFGFGPVGLSTGNYEYRMRRASFPVSQIGSGGTFDHGAADQPDSDGGQDGHLYCGGDRYRPVELSVAEERDADQRRVVVHLHDSGDNDFR